LSWQFIHTFVDRRYSRRKSPALVLRLTGTSERWVRPVFGQYVGARFVVENTAQPVAEAGRGEPRRDACLTHDVHIRSLLYQQLEQGIPSAVRRAEQGVLIEGGNPAGRHAHVQQKLDGLDRLLLGDRTFAHQTIQG